MAAAEASTVSSALSTSAEGAADSDVSPHARNKIILRLARIGEERCKSLIEEFNLCCKGRSFGMVFCKGKYDVSQDCMHRYMNEENFKLVARRWISQGRPRKPNWEVLLAGIQEEGDRLGQVAAEGAGATKA